MTPTWNRLHLDTQPYGSGSEHITQKSFSKFSLSTGVSVRLRRYSYIGRFQKKEKTGPYLLYPLCCPNLFSVSWWNSDNWQWPGRRKKRWKIKEKKGLQKPFLHLAEHIKQQNRTLCINNNWPQRSSNTLLLHCYQHQSRTSFAPRAVRANRANHWPPPLKKLKKLFIRTSIILFCRQSLSQCHFTTKVISVIMTDLFAPTICDNFFLL